MSSLQTPAWKAKPGATPAPAPATPAEDGAALDEQRFSALDLRDRVVIMLLFDQIVSEDRVAEVWALWKQQYDGEPQEPLWRFLTLVHELDRELIFAEAARVYGIEEARIVRQGALALIRKLTPVFPKPVWEELGDLRLVPIAEAAQHHSHRMRLIFASHDPTHPDVQSLLPKLGLGGYELRYATEVDLVDLLAEAFPWKYQRLKKALEKERKLFAPALAVPGEATDAPVVAEAAEALEDELMETAHNSSSIINLFEDILVQAVRHHASGVCIVPNQEGAVEVYFQNDDVLEQWRTIDHIQPGTLLATIKSTVIRADYSNVEATQKEVIKRWIDGKLLRFRVSALPASEKLNLESIVIRVLR